MKKIKIGVLASGGGSNFQALFEATKTPLLENVEIVLLIANKESAFALERAKKAGIESLFLSPKNFPDRTEYFKRITQELSQRSVEIVCLAGFLLKLEKNIIQHFKNNILNIHPALLPNYGGHGMYGHFVHEAVIKNRDNESGCTVHLVDEEYDHGPTIGQAKVEVLADDTPESLAKKVLVQEHKLYPVSLAKHIKDNFR